MMTIHLELLPTIAVAAIVISWLAFALVFITRKQSPKSPDKKRDPRSVKGIVIQGLSFGVAWGAHRSYFTPLVRGPYALEATLSIIAIVLAVASVVFTMMAVRVLGKEWSLTARVVEGHKLATHGPYSLVRHPIYTGMLGMLLATGLAVSFWPALIISVVIFFIGTVIRIRIEEGLLREMFGVEYDDYARRVSAVVPGIY
ncbi:MAG TPA: isoprenylcysteine carboxylmethyltransferase family protein [Pyrinomonadaceae bacterium]